MELFSIRIQRTFQLVSTPSLREVDKVCKIIEKEENKQKQ